MTYKPVTKSSKIMYSGGEAFFAVTGFDNVTYIRPLTEHDVRPFVVYRNGVCQRCDLSRLDCECLK